MSYRGFSLPPVFLFCFCLTLSTGWPSSFHRRLTLFSFYVLPDDKQLDRCSSIRRRDSEMIYDGPRDSFVQNAKLALKLADTEIQVWADLRPKQHPVFLEGTGKAHRTSTNATNPSNDAVYPTPHRYSTIYTFVLGRLTKLPQRTHCDHRGSAYFSAEA